MKKPIKINDRILRAAKHYRKCQDSFLHFVVASFNHIPSIGPKRKYKHNWHIEIVAAALQAAYEGRITRLILAYPPRGMKSTLLSVMFPAWVWGPKNSPDMQFLSGSHSEGLAVRDAVYTRRLINTDWYRLGWGHRFRLTGDQNEKKRYENDHGGHRITFGMGSGITGWDGDFVVIDDAHDAKIDGFSKAERESKIETYNNAVSIRLNDPNKSRIIVSGQMVHSNDLANTLIRKQPDLWTVIRIPFFYEAASASSWDPRTKEREEFWPGRYGPDFVKEMKENLGTRGIACQLQQNPLDEAGGLIKLDWFVRYDHLPPQEVWEEVVQFWDTASKDKELVNCPWVCMTVVKAHNVYYVKDIHRDWYTYPDGKAQAIKLANLEQPNAIVIEDKGTGQSLCQEMERETRWPIHRFEPEGDKDTRLATESPAIEAGKVYLPRYAHWLADYERELKEAPHSDYKDQCDVTSMMLKYFREHAYDFVDLTANTEGWPDDEWG